MVHLCGKRYTMHRSLETLVKVYSNCDEVILQLNGKEVAMEKGENAVYLSGNLTLKEGENKVVVLGKKNGKELKDQTVWYYVKDEGK